MHIVAELDTDFSFDKLQMLHLKPTDGFSLRILLWIDVDFCCKYLRSRKSVCVSSTWLYGRPFFLADNMTLYNTFGVYIFTIFFFCPSIDACMESTSINGI